MLDFRILGPSRSSARKVGSRSAARGSGRCSAAWSSAPARWSRPTGCSTSSGGSGRRGPRRPRSRTWSPSCASSSAPDVLVTRPPGYVLQVEPDQVDAVRFERLVAEARGLPAAERSKRIAEALALWRGPPLADLEFELFAEGEVRRLEELRLDALEERIDADLELGLGSELVPELESLVGRHPLRERLRRPADARPLPLRAPGRGAPGLPRLPADARRRARRRPEPRAEAGLHLHPAAGGRARAGGRRRSPRTTTATSSRRSSPVAWSWCSGAGSTRRRGSTAACRPTPRSPRSLAESFGYPPEGEPRPRARRPSTWR